MTSAPRILLIGYGALAHYVVEHLHTHTSLRLSGILQPPEHQVPVPKGVESGSRPEDFSFTPEVVLELASHEAVREWGPVFLEAGADFGLVSIGALAEASTLERLQTAAAAGGAQVHALSGAIGAMDALASAKVGGLEQVLYCSRKPVRGWKGTPAEAVLDLDSLTEATPHFTGSAREAALRYPKNANVAATVALSGIGFEATQVELIADPEATGNTHEVRAQGGFGELQFRITGLPIPGNPKSSALTAMCAVRFLLNRTGTLVI